MAEARKAEGKTSASGGAQVKPERATDQVGKALGVSGRSVERMTAISKKASDESHPDHELAKELESGLDAGTETLNSADTKLREAAEARKAEGKTSAPTGANVSDFKKASEHVAEALGKSPRSVERMASINKKASDESHPDHELAKELESGLDAGIETLNSATSIACGYARKGVRLAL